MSLLQVAAVVRVYASEVGHLRRLMEPLAGRAARRLGQLLEAKQRHMHWLKLGPAPAADAPSPISMLLPGEHRHRPAMEQPRQTVVLCISAVALNQHGCSSTCKAALCVQV
jgi:hypothetical protein